ncbi:MAG: hypothetical protein AAGF99_16335 [Bacteroidota bacterium]
MTTDFKDALDKANRLTAAERMRLAREILQGLEDEKRDEAPFVSAHEKAKHLIGPGDGVGDGSTNKAYLDDLGERSLP